MLRLAVTITVLPPAMPATFCSINLWRWISSGNIVVAAAGANDLLGSFGGVMYYDAEWRSAPRGQSVGWRNDLSGEHADVGLGLRRSDARVHDSVRWLLGSERWVPVELHGCEYRRRFNDGWPVLGNGAGVVAYDQCAGATPHHGT